MLEREGVSNFSRLISAIMGNFHRNLPNTQDILLEYVHAFTQIFSRSNLHSLSMNEQLLDSTGKNDFTCFPRHGDKSPTIFYLWASIKIFKVDKFYL